MESKQTDRFKKPSLGRAANNSDPLITQNTFPFSLLACIAFKNCSLCYGSISFHLGKTPFNLFTGASSSHLEPKREKKGINVSFKHLLANLRYMHNLT